MSCRLALVSALALAPFAASAEPAPKTEAKPGRAAAVLVVRSYDRVEQRIRDFVTLAKAPGADEMALGLVKMQLGGLAGLDKTRPIVAAMPTVSLLGQPRFAVAVPVTDKAAVTEVLRMFFPGLKEKDGLLELRDEEEGDDDPKAVARFDADGTVLRFGTLAADLAAADPAAAAGLLGASDDTDIVLRFDVEALREQKAPFLSMVEGQFEEGLQRARDEADQKAGGDETETQKALREALIDVLAQAARQAGADLSCVDLRIALPNTGWLIEASARAKAGSPTASFLAAQSGRPSRAAALFSPKAPLKVEGGLRLTPDIRKAAEPLLAQARKAVDEKIAGDADSSEADRSAQRESAGRVFDLAAKWLAQPALEAAFEVAGPKENAGIAGWVPLADAPALLKELFAAAEREKKDNVKQDVDSHAGVAIHRFENREGRPPRGLQEMDTDSGYLAADADCLIFRTGKDVAVIKQCIDRSRKAAAAPPGTSDAFFRMTFDFRGMADVGWEPENMDAVGRAIVEKMLEGDGSPLVFETVARREDAALRIVLPGSFVKAVAEAAGDQLREQMRNK